MVKITQSNIFDFLEKEPEKKEITIVNLENYEHIPVMEHDEILKEMQELISNGTIKQTDKYFRLSLSYIPHIEKSYDEDNYVVIALAWSDSAVYNYVYENGGYEISTQEYLNYCDSFGAYTKRAWEIFNANPKTTPKDFMEMFKIKEHIRPLIFANGTHEECEKALAVLVDWNRTHIKSLSELQADTKYNFIRINRKKGEIESTRCMNGECIGGILTRENAF